MITCSEEALLMSSADPVLCSLVVMCKYGPILVAFQASLNTPLSSSAVLYKSTLLSPHTLMHVSVTVVVW